ncbi:hypothetical protein ACQEV2_34010 [Streptomyces sp. CA-251387]|uniref:hypothetical protein n=1 Tax=Streptomyces sp. CA-251387 TaxID=3240064 RepID=UPI003D8B7478
MPDETYGRRMAACATLDAAGSRLALVGRPASAADLPVTGADHDNCGGGLDVPGDVPVVGYDDVPFARPT